MKLHPLTIALAYARDSMIANPCRPAVLPMHRVLSHACAVVRRGDRLALARLPLPTSEREATLALSIGELVFEGR
jgi:hypothetical protein